MLAQKQTYWNLSVFEYRCRAARLLQCGGENTGKPLENSNTNTLSTENNAKPSSPQANSVQYLLRTCSETYLALKFSIMARLAWSISF